MLLHHAIQLYPKIIIIIMYSTTTLLLLRARYDVWFCECVHMSEIAWKCWKCNFRKWAEENSIIKFRSNSYRVQIVVAAVESVVEVVVVSVMKRVYLQYLAPIHSQHEVFGLESVKLQLFFSLKFGEKFIKLNF